MASSLALLQHLIVKPSSSSFTTTLLIKPLALSLTPRLQKSIPTIFPSPYSSLPRPRSRFSSNSSSSSSASTTPSLIYPEAPYLPTELEDESKEEERHTESQSQEQQQKEHSETPIKVHSLIKSAAKLPTLTVKEKKELTAYAHSLGKKLKVQQVGKWGVTDSVAAAFVENLESNELLKLKIQNNCQAELPDVIKLLEVKTGSVAIGQIGRTVILYRPSLTKLKAEEKKREAQRIHSRRVYRPRPTEFRVKPSEFRSKPDDEQVEKKRRPAPKLSSRGRRGMSRNELP